MEPETENDIRMILSFVGENKISTFMSRILVFLLCISMFIQYRSNVRIYVYCLLLFIFCLVFTSSLFIFNLVEINGIIHSQDYIIYCFVAVFKGMVSNL